MTSTTATITAGLAVSVLVPVAAQASCLTETAEELARGLTRVDNGGGTFHFALKTGASTSPQTGSIMTWVYDGQQDYPCNATGLVPHVAEGDEEPEDPSEGADSLMGAIRIDTIGRRWKVTSIDWVDYHYFVADYWADVDATIGLDIDPVGSPPAQDQDDYEDSNWTIHPFSNPSSYIYDKTCDSSGREGIIVWGSSDLRTSSDLTSLASKYSGYVQVDGCGGALLTDTVAVTAAHCVDDKSTVNVKTRSGAVVAADVMINPKYHDGL